MGQGWKQSRDRAAAALQGGTWGQGRDSGLRHMPGLRLGMGAGLRGCCLGGGQGMWSQGMYVHGLEAGSVWGTGNGGGGEEVLGDMRLVHRDR